jgi:hypothetical protein
MAAGLGFKDFATGEVLTAADVDGYLMQGIWVFASTAARDAAVTAPAEGNFAFTKDTNSLWYYDGAAWVASGATGDIEGVTAGVGISGGGTSGTVTVTNSMATAITTAGDTLYGTGSGTFSRLGIGTAGQVLKVNSGATAPEWAAASSGAMVKIASAPFSASAGVAINECFTSTYTDYILIVSGLGDAGQANVFLQFQTGTSTVYSGSTYYGSLLKLTEAGSVSYVGNSAAQKFTMGTPASNTRYTFTATINNVGDGSRSAAISSVGNMVGGATLQGGLIDATNVYTGLYLTGSGNITGNYAIYGLVK